MCGLPSLWHESKRRDESWQVHSLERPLMQKCINLALEWVLWKIRVHRTSTQGDSRRAQQRVAHEHVSL
eukprot:1083540-Rhodomonas_salina.2